VTHPKLSLLSIMVVATSALVFSVLLMIGCGPGRNGSRSDAPGTFGLTYVFKASQEGVSQLQSVTLVWSGVQTDGPPFPPNSQTEMRDLAASWTSTSVNVPNLHPGGWTLSVTVNGEMRTCPGATYLPPGQTIQATLTFDQSINSVYCTPFQP
jgi:hypothetical protein